MSLPAGTRLGPCEIVSPLGAGGMGEVYRARDTQLKRDVALKVLPAEVAADADRLARFQREAELLAALNHPHIAQIHGIAEQAGVRAIVMELVEGMTLAERIAKEQGSGIGDQGPGGRGKGLPLDEALPIAAQLADALEYAHEHGIIHRDLKPANIKLTPDGAVKVLDFGLAKALAADAGSATAGALADSPTMSSPARLRQGYGAAGTEVGVILGTAAYMAPEQARGAAVDKRADIWAFGAVLFEMLAGRPCFAGETITDVLAAVVRAEPDWSALPAETPPRVRELLQHCLAKDRRQRLHDIGDARLELEEARATPDGPAAGPASSLTPAAAATAGYWPRRRAVAVIAPLGALLAGAALLLAWTMTREPASVEAVHAEITLPDGHALYSSPAISPDGRTVAFASAAPSQQSRLYVRRLTEGFDARPVPGSEDAVQPFFSPDGRQVAYFAQGKLWRVALDGGLPVSVANAPAPRGGTWGDDDSIVFVPVFASGLWQVRADGQGKPTLLLEPDGTVAFGLTHPRFLPGARDLLFTIWGKELGPARLDVARKEWARVVADCWSNASYAPTGHIVFGCLPIRGEIEAVADDRANRTTGHTRTVVQERVFADYIPAEFYYDLSLNGTLVYAPGDISQRAIVLVDPSGVASEPVVSARGFYESKPAISPDQKRLAYTRNGRIHVWDRERENETLLTTEDGAGLIWHDRGPCWWPDGSRLVFYSNREGNWDLYTRDTAGGGIESLLKAADSQVGPLSISKDGTLAYIQTSPTTSFDIWLRRPDGTRTAWGDTPANEVHPSFDPSGRFIAYVSDKSGSNEIYVRATEGSREEGTKVSTAGGLCPAWSPGGDRLFYREGTKIMAVAMRRDGTPAGKPSALFDGGWALGTAGGLPAPNVASALGFDVMPDGRHFLMLRAEPEAVPTRLHVIFNWFEILKRKMAR